MPRLGHPRPGFIRSRSDSRPQHSRGEFLYGTAHRYLPRSDASAQRRAPTSWYPCTLSSLWAGGRDWVLPGSQQPPAAVQGSTRCLRCRRLAMRACSIGSLKKSEAVAAETAEAPCARHTECIRRGALVRGSLPPATGQMVGHTPPGLRLDRA
jgi:hypothetical protein